MAPWQAKMLDGGSCRQAKNPRQMALQPMMEASGIYMNVYIYINTPENKIKKLTYAKNKLNW